METIHLPPELWHQVFEQLSGTDILAVTEVCRDFNTIISSSDRLTKKLTLYLKYPIELNAFADSISPTRKYRNLYISKSRDRMLSCMLSCDDPSQPNSLLQKLGESIKNLKIDWKIDSICPRDTTLLEINRRRFAFRVVRAAGEFPDLYENPTAAQVLASVREDIYNEFYHVVRYFTIIETLTLFNVHLERDRLHTERELIFNHLKELKVQQCDAMCFNFLSSCDYLKKLEVIQSYWNSRNPGVENFERFLINQKVLKELRIKNFQYPRLFQIDRTDDIVFKLETLELKNVYFADKIIANNFFRTQSELKTVDLELHNEKVRALDEISWYNNILKSIVTRNVHLNTIIITKQRYKIDNLDFIANVKNHNVKKLEFSVSSDDTEAELFKAFIKMFPNLEEVKFKSDISEDTDSGTCFEEGTVLDKVRKLVITNAAVRSLVNFEARSLCWFEYVPGKTGEFIDDFFGKFLYRHKQIKHLIIGNETERYFFVSYNLAQLIVNFLADLESITIYNFAEVNKSVKLLCNLTKLKTLTLSKEDYQQFTAKTKVACARNLKIVHVDNPIQQKTLFQS